MGIIHDLEMLTLRVLENRVGILTGDGCDDGLSMLKVLEVCSSGFDGVGLGKIGRWCGKLGASWLQLRIAGAAQKWNPLSNPTLSSLVPPCLLIFHCTNTELPSQ